MPPRSSQSARGVEMNVLPQSKSKQSGDGGIKGIGYEKGTSCLFPCNLCAICPPCLTACFPANITNIQDFTHLAMSLGILFGWGLLIWGFYVVIFQPITWIAGILPFIRYDGPKCYNEREFFCAPHGIIFLITPSVFYWWSLIKQYDQEIMSKKAQLQDLQAQNQELFSTTIKEMEGVLENQVENNSGLAEKSFDSKKRDFLHYVKAAKKKYASFVLLPGDLEQLTNEFRQFVRQWLIIFEEASVDPVNKPILIAGPGQEALDSLTTLTDIADWVIEKLGATKVNFISNAMKDDKKMIAQGKAEERRIHDRMIEGKYGLIMSHEVELDGNVMRICFEEWAAISRQAKRIRETGNSHDIALLEEGVFGRRVSLTADEPEKAVESKCTLCECTWWRCTTTRLHLTRDEDQVGNFPYVCYGCCFNIVFLSREHLYLMFAIPVVIGACVLAMLLPQPQLFILGAYVFVFLAVIVVMLRFEQIDEVLRLESEVKDLKKRAEQLEDKKKRMNDFWKEVQNIADLWLHRTVPRLEVVKEAHGHLEDARPEDLLHLLSSTNKALQNLEAAVGERKLWLHDGGISDQDKKRFGETIYKLSNNTSLPKVLEGLNTATGMIGDVSKRVSLTKEEGITLMKAITAETTVTNVTLPYQLG